MKKLFFVIILCFVLPIYTDVGLPITQPLIEADMKAFTHFVEKDITPKIMRLYPPENAGWFTKFTAKTAHATAAMLYTPEEMIGAKNLVHYCAKSNKAGREAARLYLMEDPKAPQAMNELIAELQGVAKGDEKARIKHNFSVKWLKEEGELMPDENLTLEEMPIRAQSIKQEAFDRSLTRQLFVLFYTTKKTKQLSRNKNKKNIKMAAINPQT